VFFKIVGDLTEQKLKPHCLDRVLLTILLTTIDFLFCSFYDFILCLIFVGLGKLNPPIGCGLAQFLIAG